MKITTTTAENFFQREGVISKPIRKPENLPEGLINIAREDLGRPAECG
jgi:hypothetical protein